MSAISVFAEKVGQHQEKIDAAVSGIQADVSSLKEQIEKLQSTPGEITPEDQALLDGIEAKTGAIAEKVEALDGLTPPPTPAH